VTAPSPAKMRVWTVWAVLGLTAGIYMLRVWPSLSGQMVNWRESYVLMVGRDLCRGEGTLWLPRVDTVAEGPGTTGMELPLLDLGAAALACGGAGQVVVARVLIVLFALLGLAAVGVLAIRELRPEGAMLAIVSFAFSPLVLFYGRTIQPDIPSLSLALVSLALLDLAVPDECPTRWWLYFASAATMATAALVKLPVIVYGLPLLAMLWSRRGRGAATDWRYWAFLPISVVPPTLWYLHARALQRRYGLYDFFLGAGLPELFRTWATPSFYQSIFVQQLFDTYAFPLLSGIAVLSLALRWRSTPLWVRAMAVCAIAFFFIAGRAAAWHFSYGLVAVPPIVFASAVGAQELLACAPGPRSRAVLLGVCLAAVVFYGSWRARKWFAAAAVAPAITPMKEALDARLPAGERVLVLSGGDPKLLWYLDRKGPVVGGDLALWLSSSATHPSVVALDSVASRGWAEVARLALPGAGYRPIYQDSAMELWLQLPPGPVSAPRP
jgi:Dolichyl-phosphate-mannose-protein mannosyltransferase